MTTADLIIWVGKAETVYENSFTNVNGRIGYELSKLQAIQKTKPTDATKVDESIAFHLICYMWNEVQIWNELQKTEGV